MKNLIYGSLIVAAAVFIYLPGLGGDWLWDDDLYFLRNSNVHDPSGFWKAWTHLGGPAGYAPLTATVQWWQWQTWGDSTPGYHLTNLLLHLGSVFLLWHLFLRLGITLAPLGALLFMVHPVTVESVAWISELKNTLSLPLLLLAMICWLDYDESRRPGSYFLALGFFVLVLLAKTADLMLPAILLGYAGWKRGKVTWHDLRLCLPFAAVAVVAAISTVMTKAPSSSAMVIVQTGVASCWASAGWAMLFMLGKALFPVALLPAYPGRIVEAPGLTDVLPWMLIAGGFLLAWRHRAGWGRAVLAGMGFYFINLVPVAAYILKNCSTMIWSLDHLQYVALIGVTGLAAVVLEAAYERLSPSLRPVGVGLVGMAGGLLALQAHDYAGKFADEETLWGYTAKRAPDFVMAEDNLGRALLKAGRGEEAKPHFEKILQLRSNTKTRASTLYSLGEIAISEGRFAEAVAKIEEAMTLGPDDGEMEDNLAVAYVQEGELPEAIEHFNKAIALSPGDATTYNNLGTALARNNRYPEAADVFTRGLKVSPRSGLLEDNLGVVLMKLGRSDEAKQHFEHVLSVDPDDALARQSLQKLANGSLP